MNYSKLLKYATAFEQKLSKDLISTLILNEVKKITNAYTDQYYQVNTFWNGLYEFNVNIECFSNNTTTEEKVPAELIQRVAKTVYNVFAKHDILAEIDEEPISYCVWNEMMQRKYVHTNLKFVFQSLPGHIKNELLSEWEEWEEWEF